MKIFRSVPKGILLMHNFKRIETDFIKSQTLMIFRRFNSIVYGNEI